MSQGGDAERLRLSLYELLLAVETAAELAQSGSAKAFPASWPSIARLVPERLAAARACADAAAQRAVSDVERAPVDAMREAIDELEAAYGHMSSGPRNQVLGRVLARTVTRVKGRSLSWTAPVPAGAKTPGP
jgi:hypothetical protein